jgi:phosphatidylserine/phosphatidylglycerophosphate/cardiolipin synthase-like enzyme
MRKLAKNQNDDFRVKAYAGTNGVLLAIDLDESRKKDLLGFAIEQKEKGKKWEWLLNSLTFPGRQHTLPKFNATPSNEAPIQKFRWADYSINPGTTCSYRVYPVYRGQNDLADPLEVTVKTDDGKPAKHEVYFNRAVAASQAFGRKFPQVDAFLKTNKDVPIEKWPDVGAREWLENGLLECIVGFIERAKDSSWTMDIAIYEYELKAIVDAVNAAHKRGVKIRILYHAKVGDEQTSENEKSLKKIPVSMKKGRITNKIFHNKFIVLSKIGASGKRKPQAVLCGSTNFTENGVYRQANVVHVVDKPDLAGSYLSLFEEVWKNPSDTAATKKWIGLNNAIDSDTKLWAGFSPRAGKVDLQEFIRILNNADKDLLFATAFVLPEDILDAILGAENDAVLRYGIQNSASRITGYHADRTAEFAVPAMLNNGLDNWVKEGLRGQRGNLLIHAKTIVTNFTTDNPTVLSGSHNLSASASGGNDENYLIMRGDTDLADRYGLEIMRFYEHYRFRYYAKKLKLQQARPLAEDDSWTQPYYTEGDLKQSSRLRFAGREL